MCNLGTFADYIVVHEASVIRVEEWYDLRAAALLSCGISTGFGAAVNRFKWPHFRGFSLHAAARSAAPVVTGVTVAVTERSLFSAD